ncbi:hypothetical protein FKW77_004634 [Venturia effusa]|uniref:Uncharacterized protein n=1 Tax=Venturia effusa TaxID=50376 RepID=A0A517LK48_9PEZI|nr:hypothetical protein FKW77_004634 [Venturia effusa]
MASSQDKTKPQEENNSSPSAPLTQRALYHFGQCATSAFRHHDPQPNSHPDHKYANMEYTPMERYLSEPSNGHGLAFLSLGGSTVLDL